MTEKPSVIRSSTIPPVEHTPGGSARLLEGEALGMGDVSLILSDNPPGGGAITHRHPYVELFVLQQGRGVYTVGDKQLMAEAGDVVVVPAGEWHSFRNDGEERLAHVAIHQSARSVTEVPPRSNE